ncbi:hypothetical protein [Methylosinus sp. Ce-a6]|uniref:hypothetical protein n=1 Tax=Methylosinus sp. Ce-a6 TaxID=2172005 RepID=UPI0013568804|nr:hypothetical protein [Methylosinus sp. Ce-a6]
MSERTEEAKMENIYRDFLQELLGIHARMIERLLLDEPTPVLAALFLDLGKTYLRISEILQRLEVEGDEYKP